MSREFALRRPCSWLMVLHTPIRLKSCIQAVVPTLAGLHAWIPGGTIGQTGAPDSGRHRPPPRQGTRIGCGPQTPAPGDAFTCPLAGRSRPRLAECTQAYSDHTAAHLFFSLNSWPCLNISSLSFFPLNISLGEGTSLFYSIENNILNRTKVFCFFTPVMP